MGRARFKFGDYCNRLKDISDRCHQESADLRKHSSRSIRQSDDLIAQSRHAIRRARELLRTRGAVKSADKTHQSDPNLDFGELLINGNKNQKRRADD